MDAESTVAEKIVPPNNGELGGFLFRKVISTSVSSQLNLSVKSKKFCNLSFN